MPSTSPFVLADVLNARGARQGLLFDGTAGATIAGLSAVNLDDFTFVAWLTLDAIGTTQTILGGNAVIGQPLWTVSSSGKLQLTVGQGQTLVTGSAALVAGKSYLVAVTRVGVVSTTYINGVLDNAQVVQIAENFTVPVTSLGYDAANSTNAFKGLLGVMVYNRALSAAELLELYEQGVPQRADYNAKPTANSSTCSNLAGFVYDSFTGATSSGFSAVAGSTAGLRIIGTEPVFTVHTDQVVKVTFNAALNSGSLGVYAGLVNAGGSTYAINSTAITVPEPAEVTPITNPVVAPIVTAATLCRSSILKSSRSLIVRARISARPSVMMPTMSSVPPSTA